jgi:hypothetical protein
LTKARLDGLYLMLLGSAVFLSLGALLATTSPIEMVDFRVLYYPARCLMQHCDPYNESELLQFSTAAQGGRSADVAKAREIMRYIYLPTAFTFTVPFAMLPWGFAHFLWMALIAGSLIFSSFLMWSLGADHAPILSGILVGFLLANSEMLVITGNTAGIAISLGLVAVWCFLRNRFVVAGIVCLAVSLVVKPHDTGLVWLFFFLAGGVHRKRAGQTLLLTLALSLPAVLWVSHVTPHWIGELHSNIVEYAAPGNLNDPGVASSGAHGLGMLVSLQAIFGILWDNPSFYNPASYLVCAPLLLLWAVTALRSRFSYSRAWLALAAIAPLTLLPVYHRQQDTKLLLLTIPACAMLCAEGGLLGKLAVLINGAAFFLSAELPWAILLALMSRLPPPATWGPRAFEIAVQVFPIPLILLATGIFYLWVYVRRGSSHAPQAETERSMTPNPQL